MTDHVCIIGLLHHSDYSELATVANLKEHIAERIEHNRRWREMGIVSNWVCKPEWSLKDYCDMRRKTNLWRFVHCPECGKKIDWKRIGREENAAD